MDVVPIVDRAYGMPVRAATRATAGSPSVCSMRVNPVGAKTSGALEGAPRIVVEVSTSETSRSTCGRNSTRAYACLERRSAISCPAAPSA